MYKIKEISNSNNPHEDGLKLLKDLINKDKLEIKYNENGKPYLKDNSLYFSISHSFDHVICIISDLEVGIDIEKVRDYDPNILNLLKMNECNNEDFFINWTKREAYIKCYGLSLKNINIKIDNNIKTYVKDGYVISICFKKRVIL
jgi:4'-phosphopantetheinyl transferase